MLSLHRILGLERSYACRQACNVDGDPLCRGGEEFRVKVYPIDTREEVNAADEASAELKEKGYIEGRITEYNHLGNPTGTQ
jgi:hypothetical protein